MPNLRDFLLLSRGSGLPAVISHSLAGWWLGGGVNAGVLPWLILGVTCLYLGGSFTNDAFDAAYDKDHRRTRPIPSGRISANAVWAWGSAWFVVGLAVLFRIGLNVGGFGLAIASWALLYNATHRALVFSPALLAICRFLVYLLGSTAGAGSVSGSAIWCGVALGLYSLGAQAIARSVALDGLVRFWPVLLLSVPIALAVVMNGKGTRESALLLSIVLALWVIINLRRIFWAVQDAVIAPSAGLQAGMIFVDWLACANGPRPLSAIFVGLFLTALLLQKFPGAPAAERAPAI